MEMLSTIVNTPPSWVNVFIPSKAMWFGTSKAYRFVEPVTGLDHKGGVEYQNTQIKWMYYNKTDDEYYLDMNGDRDDWSNVIRFTSKKN